MAMSVPRSLKSVSRQEKATAEYAELVEPIPSPRSLRALRLLFGIHRGTRAAY
jgi:hypothetical protein